MTTASTDYPWERLWYSRDRPMAIAPDGLAEQLLIDRWFPGGERLVPISRVAHFPCLILLGDAGMGKSRTMKAHFNAVHEEGIRAGTEDCVRWASLNEFSSAAEVAEEIFRHPDVRKCIHGSGTVRLFLDSYDEGVVRLGTLGNVVRRELDRLQSEGLPKERLQLRIISRPSLAPDDLLPSLQQLFGKENVGVYILAPLGRDAITIAARAEQIDPAEFMRAVAQRSAGPLAAKPLSLRMLLTEFAAGGTLQREQAALFEDACLRHCDAWNPSRFYPAHLARRLTNEQTLRVVSRIAAAIVLSGRSQIWTGPDYGDVGGAYVPVAELCTTDPGARLAEAEVREVLECGLFADAGEYAVRFYNHSVAEYLAASHLVRSGLTPVQLDELLTVSLNGVRWIVPPLVETAAWFESLSPGSLRDALAREPEAWLRSSAELSQAHRPIVTTSLLALYGTGEAYDDLDTRGEYERLNHPELAAIVRPYLQDPDRHPVARRVAASIAGACKLTELQAELADLALDETAPGTVRQNAIDALSDLADDATLARLRPLATDPLAEDTQDEIKGRVLRALWPRLLTVEEILSALTERKDSRLTGAYSLFTGGRMGFASRLTPDQMIAALNWLAAQPSPALRRTMLSGVAQSVVRAAISEMGRPDVLSAVADVAVHLLRERDSLLHVDFPGPADKTFPADPHLRRALAARIVAATVPDRTIARRTIFTRPPLLTGEDLDWINDRCEHADAEERPVWRELAGILQPPAEEVADA